MSLPLPPPPKEAISNIFAWREWFYKLWQQVTATTALYFNNLNFSGSNITSIEVRNHNDLTTLQGGTNLQRYHLSASQYNSIASGISVTITTSALTLTGTQGSMTFTNGILTAQTQAT